ncbi:MAG: carotenoid 1,2-hydratase [Betaproteobacteria bacterium]
MLASIPLFTLFRGVIAAYPDPSESTNLAFPRDLGSHPAFRTEWWYITGWWKDQLGQDYGLQITFFRSRPAVQEDNPSALAPRQLIFAHSAISDPKAGVLRHDQRAGRAGLGLAGAAETTTHVWIEDWSLARTVAGYVCRIPARDYAMDLQFEPSQPLLLEGVRGFSRKGPGRSQASHYYSEPHLVVSGTIAMADGLRHVTGTAWLDHEWSSQYLAAAARGWDWIGINFHDGGALMAFRIRGKRGEDYWAGGTYRDTSGRVTTYTPGQIRFSPVRRWTSPRTQIDYPVAMHVHAGDMALELEPLMDDQELDSRGSTNAIYWEGAVRVRRGGIVAGLGYLELTGYGSPLAL